MQPFTLVGALVLLLHISSGNADAQRHYQQVLTGSQPGVCRYGRRLECCYGWKKNSKGQCEAQCDHGCKHGECVGPNKCKCFPGHTGKTCNQDLNECGLKPRPCQHRCMNTFGSYKCYCLNGYTVMSDGSCANSNTCSIAHCQYGCEEVQGEIRCLCPSAGLQLGQDGRTCVDLDECVTGKNLCPYNRQCVNTFGSYLCKCQDGYDLKYVDAKYDCVAIPDSQVRPELLGGTLDNQDIRNLIPEPVATLPPRIREQPFDYDGEVYVGPKQEQVNVFPLAEEEEQEEDEEVEDNRLNQRGDVFVSEDFESVFGPATEVKEMLIAPVQEEFIMDCNFDQGACEWIQDKTDDMDWSVSYHNDAEYYMAMSGLLGEPEDIAKLKLLLSDRAQQGSFCLTFDFRVVGQNVGSLKVLLDNNAYPVWEQSRSRDQAWQTEILTVTWKEEAPTSIFFEAQHGKEVGGEIGLDNVVLTSGPCQEDVSPFV
ncbi:epidermal growth factor-like protein 6 isoform X2 [Notothenia coriiceps]|uniref:Epidermal growth factor-like protein 6 isoform X2 n=1 Tax=Notothenia coriiceps TaxID=8208 RepID=A0A6I9NBW9_9TELE|nr:PREDICTED: epidermal growth factor-like protein 6 isoform X2 [Notothenia coriiceps]